jgi:MoaA/NifB/PqqE/SkfB family radical SAM enzyme
MLKAILNDVLSFIHIIKCRKTQTAPDYNFFPVIWVTNQCNLRCRMCDQWKAKTEGELTKEEWYVFIDSAARMKARVIVITGGEPLLRQDIYEIIKYIRGKKISCHLCSNGSLLNDINTINKLKESELNSISISLDSSNAQIYKNIRGVDYFDTVVGGIKLLKKNVPAIKVGINCLITRLNFVNLDRMIYFAQSLKVNQIKFDIVHTNLMHKNKPLISFEGITFTPDDLPGLKTEIDKLIVACSKSRLLTNSRTFLKGILPFYQKQHNKFKCYAGYVSCAIDALGRVSPCENFDGQESLRNKRFEEIWREPSFQQLRQKVRDCQECCWDSTHGEINIRCSLRGLLKEFPQVIREQFFYL